MKDRSFRVPPSLAIAEGATTPDPGGPGVVIWSTTAGKPLSWNGAAWASLAGATPGLVPLSPVQIVGSAVASVDITSGIDSTYDEYELHFAGVVPASSGALQMRTSSDGGTTFDSTGGDYTYTSGYVRGNVQTFECVTSSGNAYIQIFGNVMSATASHGGASGVVRLFAPSQTTKYKLMTFHGTCAMDATWVQALSGNASRRSTSVVNALRFFFSSGNIAEGAFRLYGVKK